MDPPGNTLPLLGSMVFAGYLGQSGARPEGEGLLPAKKQETPGLVACHLSAC